MDSASLPGARPAAFCRRLVGDVFRLAAPRPAGRAREASKLELLHLVETYETDFDATCVRMAADFDFVAVRDRLSPLSRACARLVPGESGVLRALVEAHGAVLAQLFTLAEPIDFAGAATDASVKLARLRERHAAALQQVRAQVERL